MKKLILCTALALTSASAGACGTGNFHNGWHIGGSAGAVNFSGSQSIKNTNVSYNTSSWAPVVTIDGKYAMSCDSLYRAFDMRLGWIFSSKKKSDPVQGSATLKQGLTAGVGFRLGTFMNESTITFLRLGLNANQQKFGYNFNGSRKTDRFVEYAIEPGVGVEWSVGEGKAFEVLYGYGMSFSTRGEKSEEHSFSKGPDAQHITVGFSIAL